MDPHIARILIAAGFPPKVMVLDYETFFDADYSLKKMTAPQYIADERFELLGTAWKLGDAPTTFTPTGPMVPGNVTLVGHNLGFDAMLMAMRYGVRPNYMIDTLSLARYVLPKHKVGLADVAKKLGLPAKGDTKQFKGLRFDELWADPDKLAAMRGYACGDADLTHQVFHLLLPEIDNPAIELRLIHHTTTLATTPVLRWDRGGAADLRGRMLAEQDAVLDQVSWVHETHAAVQHSQPA
ncbi:MAG: hypothetical protein AAGG38_02080 [Planctomycetota bacterium]